VHGRAASRLVVLPATLQNGHEWGPGLIIVSWVLCDCPSARAAQERAGGPAGHIAVFCNAARRGAAGRFGTGRDVRRVDEGCNGISALGGDPCNGPLWGPSGHG